MGKHQAKQNPFYSVRFAVLSMGALITAGLSTQHGPAPSNQATALTATWTDLNGPGRAVATEAPTTEPEPSAVPDYSRTPRHAGQSLPTLQIPTDQPEPAAEQKSESRPGLPLDFDPTPQDTAPPTRADRTNTRAQHRPQHREDTVAQSRPAPGDLGSLLSGIGAALNAGATLAQQLSSGSAAATPAADDASTDGSDCAGAGAPASNTMRATAKTPAGAIDLNTLLADLGTALKAGATLASTLESGSSALDAGSSLTGTGSSLAGTGSALLAPLSAAAAGSA